MKEQNHFFQWVHRVLALSALAIVAVIAYTFVKDVLFPELWPSHHAVDVPDASGKAAAPAIQMNVGDITRIKGTAVKMIEMTTTESGISGLRSGGYGSVVRNLIFVVDGQPKARWLFEKSSQRLQSIQQIGLHGEQAQSEPASTIAIFLEVIRTDSDGDGELSREDRPIPALLRPDGSGYTELGAAVEDILDTSLSEDGQRFGMLISDGGKLLYREYVIADFSLHSEQVLTELKR